MCRFRCSQRYSFACVPVCVLALLIFCLGRNVRWNPCKANNYTNLTSRKGDEKGWTVESTKRRIKKQREEGKQLTKHAENRSQHERQEGHRPGRVKRANQLERHHHGEGKHTAETCTCKSFVSVCARAKAKHGEMRCRSFGHACEKMHTA